MFTILTPLCSYGENGLNTLAVREQKAQRIVIKPAGGCRLRSSAVPFAECRYVKWARSYTRQTCQFIYFSGASEDLDTVHH